MLAVLGRKKNHGIGAFRFFWSRTFEALKDTFFPLFCLGCEAYGDWLCKQCAGNLPERADQRCPQCLKQPTPSGERCFACKETFSLDGLYAASYYHSPLLSSVVHTYKYRFVPELSLVLGTFLTASLQKTHVPMPDIVIPVPLHPRRLRFRGFNQAELLAQCLAKNLAPGLEVPIVSQVLRRIRKTKPQITRESRKERLANLHEAFAVSQEWKSVCEGKNIWLIDDVSTTGTTLGECARTLKSAGARSVFGIVLAR